MVSRGIETTSIRLRSAERWKITVVSERIPSVPSSYSPSLRTSEPIMRILTGLPSKSSTGCEGAAVGSSTSSVVTSCLSIWELSWLYTP